MFWFVLVLLDILPLSGMRAVKPGGSQCCFEQIPSPMLCRLILADHDQTLIDDQTLVTDVVSPDHF